MIFLPYARFYSELRKIPKSRRTAPAYLERLAKWTEKLNLRLDCSTSDALEKCTNEEDRSWLQRVRANEPASMAGVDVEASKKIARSLERKAYEKERMEKAKEKCEKEKQV